jgi:peptide chain release factor 1
MCIIEIQPRNGGQAAVDCAGDLAGSLSKHLLRLGVRQVRQAQAATRLITLLAPGIPAARLAWLAGVHRFQHLPPRQRGRRETSLVVVAVLDEIPAAPLEISGDDLRIDTFRGPGPGGQHRNKSGTGVRVTHTPSGRAATHTTLRSQGQNKKAAWVALERSLSRDAALQAAKEANQVRREQADPSPAFTHTEWRGTVTCHATGRQWSVRDWAQGRMSSE